MTEEHHCSVLGQGLEAGREERRLRNYLDYFDCNQSEMEKGEKKSRRTGDS